MTIRKASISTEDNQRLNELLEELGYIYERTETRTRYDLGGFISDIVNADRLYRSGDTQVNFLNIPIPNKEG